MLTIIKRKAKKKTVKRTLTKQEKLEKLVKEIDEAREGLRKGKSVKGSAEDVIRYLRNEANQSK